MKQLLFFFSIIFTLKFCRSDRILSGECLDRGSSRLSPNECFKLKVNEKSLTVENIYTEKVTWNVETDGANISRACLEGKELGINIYWRLNLTDKTYLLIASYCEN
jgi:hypothetical protein